MALVDSTHGNFTLVGGDRRGVPLYLRDFAFTFDKAVECATESSTSMRAGEERNRKKQYMFADPETKSDRERNVRVPAIVIAITEGSWNICIAKGSEHKSLP